MAKDLKAWFEAQIEATPDDKDGLINAMHERVTEDPENINQLLKTYFDNVWDEVG